MAHAGYQQGTHQIDNWLLQGAKASHNCYNGDLESIAQGNPPAPQAEHTFHSFDVPMQQAWQDGLMGVWSQTTHIAGATYVNSRCLYLSNFALQLTTHVVWVH